MANPQPPDYMSGYDTWPAPAPPPRPSVMSSVGPVIISVSRAEWTAGDIGPALGPLQMMVRSREALMQWNGRVQIGIDGLNDDPREIYEVPEVRAYLHALTLQFPFWFHVCDRSSSTLKSLMFCLCRFVKHGPGLIEINQADREKFVEVLLDRMNDLHDHFGVPVEVNEAISNELVSALGGA